MPTLSGTYLNALILLVRKHLVSQLERIVGTLQVLHAIFKGLVDFLRFVDPAKGKKFVSRNYLLSNLLAQLIPTQVKKHLVEKLARAVTEHYF